MSNYMFTAKERKTGTEFDALAYDNYFGRRKYGYAIKNYVINIGKNNNHAHPSTILHR